MMLSLISIRGNSVEREIEIDWETGVMSMEITAPLPDSDTPLPLIKHQVLQAVQREFPEYLREALLPLTMDSSHTFGDAVSENPDLIHTVSLLAQTAELETTRMNFDLTALILKYRIPLLPLLLESFASWATPTPLPEYMTYEPSAAFTGLVIYAAETLPVYGERNRQGMTMMEKVTPCFMARIFDEEGNEIFSESNMDSEYLVEYGTAAYSESTDIESYTDRVGDYPFYATARGLFGKHRTDIILSVSDIRKFLSREENHQILREGRIVVIY